LADHFECFVELITTVAPQRLHEVTGKAARVQSHEGRFRFGGVDADARATFMQRFDLHMQRGGG